MKPQRVIYSFVITGVLLYGCRQSSPTEETIAQQESKDTTVKDSVVQYWHPEQPAAYKFDTAIKDNRNTYKISITEKTADSSFVNSSSRKKGIKRIDLYANLEYIVSIKLKSKVIFADTLTKNDFREEFMEDFLQKSIMQNFIFSTWDDIGKEFQFDFDITQPDTDNSFKMQYIVGVDGKSRYVFLD